jgi:hypothetical protein
MQSQVPGDWIGAGAVFHSPEVLVSRGGSSLGPLGVPLLAILNRLSGKCLYIPKEINRKMGWLEEQVSPNLSTLQDKLLVLMRSLWTAHNYRTSYLNFCVCVCVCAEIHTSLDALSMRRVNQTLIKLWLSDLAARASTSTYCSLCFFLFLFLLL